MIALNQKQLLEEIDLLPLDMKTKIVDKLLNSLNQSNKSIDDLWIKEANNRKNEIEKDSSRLISGDEVFRKIARRFEK
ncbi:addiction module protein [Arcobacter sp. FW59]|uniref:addiction module protein n=1 Tax=Arcobacteraceae TaxID=2808963 RepID=UPI000DEAA725|nr:addiction module protein [Arcobacter sp. CECT 9188]RBQ26113.1 addiction module protein [Arcobacter sp. CECT 9188]RBQ31609.1 addiction module protein [Arcobacter sp. FW59]